MDFRTLLGEISGVVWGPVMLVLLLGTGLWLTVGLRFLPQRKLPYGIRMTLAGRTAPAGEDGDISPFQALTTALAATVGTGNIAGVATAIALGGPGAVFWMWVTALVGMATKYSEAVLAVTYRETDARGEYIGGPMYYIRNGMGRKWAWLAWLFALFATVAAFGIGNTVQANSVADVMQTTFGVPKGWTGITMAVLAFVVIIGGVKRIGQVAEALVPLMAIVYVLGALAVILVNIGEVPGVLAQIVGDAFTGTAATGGFAGAAVWAAIRFGVARGIFSNEAGLGSAPIAHAAARTREPVRQGTVAMLGTFIDTIVVCTMTALVILTSGLWTSGETGAALSAAAFGAGFEGGELIVTFGLVVFAFTTVLGWAYYGERTAVYLLGVRAILPYRLLWVVALYVGATAKLEVVWLVADVMNALMAVPNLIALLALSGVVFAASRAYFSRKG
ncbi:alanine/glycine:cation symporter family protein [Caenispirillum bisanense]|uniref:Alanine or glycine:cation symporter, AGCS family n=1 Tax=Caenispirillum bisanense TaxID=414052 RepID=A0A286H1Q9_9PROT|nr:sodium:alanine symporter family protein [Caenispirillum bisanense]SOE01697.1 alanine or glycine:cation symporter, AGCS family [Caenispirillum bisanense]